jgi:AraC-like DNA-binding protein
MNQTYSHSLINSVSENNERFEIHALEWVETQRLSWNETAEKLSLFEVIWIKKGIGVLQVDNQDYHFAANVIYCMAPGHIRKWIAETGVEGYYISFTPEFIWMSEGYSNHSLWLEQYSEDFKIKSIYISEEMQNEMEIIVRKMKWEYKNYFNQKLEVLKGLLNIFMIYFSRNLTKPGPNITQSRDAQFVNNFMILLGKHFITQKMVSDYAGQLCVTPNYLNRTVKKITGLTASHHIQQQIIKEAKKQALYQSATMKEVAYNLGFDNLAHFSKFFKNKCGMSFTDFKKRMPVL